MPTDDQPKTKTTDGPQAEPTPGGAPRADHEDDHGIVPDIIKRAISASFRAVDWGQESAKAIATGILESETLEAAGSTLRSVRGELVTVAGREIVRYLDNLNLTDEAVKILTAISLELKTEIRFIPNDERLVTPDVKARVRVKSTRDDAKAPKTKGKSKKAAKKADPPAK